MLIYVSTSCLANVSNVIDVLDTYARVGLRNVELGVTHKYIEGLSLDRFKQDGFSFLIHHYFPPPRKPFIINLASQDSTILACSKEQIKKSLDFCQSLGIQLFTFHGGFRVDPDDKLRFPRHPTVPHEIAFNTFVESMVEISSYAQEMGIRIAVENNVLSEYNVIDGQNKLLLFCEAEDFTRLWERIPSANIGVLLDLGHLKVTSHWLGFDRHDFINKLKDRVFAIHVHENDGQVDSHGRLNETSWCFEIISGKHFINLPIVLESWGLTLKQITQQVSLMEKILSRQPV